MGITWNWTGTALQIEPLYFSCGGTAHLLTPDLSRPLGFWSGLPFMHYLFSLEFFFLSSSKKNQLSCQFWQLKEKYWNNIYLATVNNDLQANHCKV